MSKDEHHAAVLEWTERKMNAFNSSRGSLDPREYDCPYCLNRGYMGYVTEDNGCIYERFVECDCLKLRKNKKEVAKSGLGNTIDEETFDNFVVRDPFQDLMLQTAKRYVEHGFGDDNWLYIGGQSGAGKTHICTAVAGQLLHKGWSLHYTVWPEEVRKLKALANDEAYEDRMTVMRAAEVLYIDDLFKPVKDTLGGMQYPTAADIRIAFELLNNRYIKHKPTIISSEWTIDELENIDEAVASRIMEMSKGYRVNIGRDRSKNQRTR